MINFYSVIPISMILLHFTMIVKRNIAALSNHILLAQTPYKDANNNNRTEMIMSFSTHQTQTATLTKKEEDGKRT